MITFLNSCISTTVSRTFIATKSTSCTNGPLNTDFSCYDDSLEPTGVVSIEDVLGACIFDPDDEESLERLSLDVVGEESGHSLMQTREHECRLDTIPQEIPASNLTRVGSIYSGGRMKKLLRSPVPRA